MFPISAVSFGDPRPVRFGSDSEPADLPELQQPSAEPVEAPEVEDSLDLSTADAEQAPVEPEEGADSVELTALDEVTEPPVDAVELSASEAAEVEAEPDAGDEFILSAADELDIMSSRPTTWEVPSWWDKLIYRWERRGKENADKLPLLFLVPETEEEETWRDRIPAPRTLGVTAAALLLTVVAGVTFFRSGDDAKPDASNETTSETGAPDSDEQKTEPEQVIEPDMTVVLSDRNSLLTAVKNHLGADALPEDVQVGVNKVLQFNKLAPNSNLNGKTVDLSVLDDPNMVIVEKTLWDTVVEAMPDSSIDEVTAGYKRVMKENGFNARSTVRGKLVDISSAFPTVSV